MLKREACQFVRFVRRQLPECSNPIGFAQSGQRGPLPRELRHDRRDGTGMVGRQAGMDRLHGGTSRGALAGDEQLHLGSVHADQGAARARPDIGSIVSHVDGRPVFEDALAWPAQGIRYWSRSKPFPRSRSFQ